MKKVKFIILSMMIMFVMALSNIAFADSYSNTINIFKKSDATKSFFKNCYGYAVFPTVGKGGIGIGGAYGKGQVYKKGKMVGTVTLAKLSIGFQLGGQAFSEIIFFQDKRAYTEFISGNFEFDASASAVIITAGVQAKAGTEGVTAGASAGPDTSEHAEINYSKGLAVFVQTKGGLMYEAAIGGQKFTFTPQ
jgi:lipid-binding SYLF domain-containing protein